MKTRKIIAIMATVLIGTGLGAHAQGILNSLHNFVGDSWYGSETNACAACHAPHGTTQTTIPLWNHTNSLNEAGFTVYGADSDTMDANPGQPTGASLACLSCHDGSIALDAFGGAVGSTFIATVNASAVVGGGGDLSHEHPISFLYADGGAGLNADTTATPNGSGETIADWLPGGSVECSSCHDPHDTAGNDKLLRASNNNSALCLTCHNK